MCSGLIRCEACPTTEKDPLKSLKQRPTPLRDQKSSGSRPAAENQTRSTRPFFTSFLVAPKATTKIWQNILRGYEGHALATFITQTRVNRVPTGTTLHRFHPEILETCHECREPDTLRHRLLHCPGRLPLAKTIKQDYAQLLFKHSHYPWPNRPPPKMADTRMLLTSLWPQREIYLHEQSTAKIGPPFMPALEER